MGETQVSGKFSSHPQKYYLKTFPVLRFKRNIGLDGPAFMLTLHREESTCMLGLFAQTVGLLHARVANVLLAALKGNSQKRTIE